MKSDTELYSLGREPKHEHEWSEWVRIAEMKSQLFLAYTESSPIKIRVCKKCKQAEFEVV